MQRALNGGAIHVSIPTIERGIELCGFGKFDALAMGPHLLEGRDPAEVKSLLYGAGIRPGAWGVPFNFRTDEETFNEGFEKMKATIGAMKTVGVTRCATWIMPGSNDMNFDRNWAFHVRRLRPIASLLADHGMTFGLEFVGPKTSRDSFRHPFVYSLGAMHEMAHRTGPNVGLLVDCWHLHSSEGSVEDLALLDPKDIALVHINDAPEGVPVDELLDHNRDLPAATGVIDLKGFMDTLRAIGYDGPVEAEPFLPSLKELPSDEERVRVTGEAVAKAFSL